MQHVFLKLKRTVSLTLECNWCGLIYGLKNQSPSRLSNTFSSRRQPLGFTVSFDLCISQPPLEFRFGFKRHPSWRICGTKLGPCRFVWDSSTLTVTGCIDSLQLTTFLTHSTHFKHDSSFNVLSRQWILSYKKMNLHPVNKSHCNEQWVEKSSFSCFTVLFHLTPSPKGLRRDLRWLMGTPHRRDSSNDYFLLRLRLTHHRKTARLREEEGRRVGLDESFDSPRVSLGSTSLVMKFFVAIFVLSNLRKVITSRCLCYSQSKG